jgi:hypothetical protein
MNPPTYRTPYALNIRSTISMIGISPSISCKAANRTIIRPNASRSSITKAAEVIDTLSFPPTIYGFDRRSPTISPWLPKSSRCVMRHTKPNKNVPGGPRELQGNPGVGDGKHGQPKLAAAAEGVPPRFVPRSGLPCARHVRLGGIPKSTWGNPYSWRYRTPVPHKRSRPACHVVSTCPEVDRTIHTARFRRRSDSDLPQMAAKQNRRLIIVRSGVQVSPLLPKGEFESVVDGLSRLCGSAILLR